jgi:lipoprotein-releasing system permease protein
MSLVSKLALRYQKKRRGFVSIVSLFSVIGITLGVAALIIVMSVMSGFRQELLKTVLGTTGHAIIQQYGYTEAKATQVTAELLKMPEITKANAFIQGQAMLTSNRQSNGVMVNGADLGKQKEIIAQLESGESKMLENNEIWVGSELAKKIGLHAGDYVNLISPDGTNTVAGFPRIKKLKVAGVFNFGMYQYDANFVYTNIKTAQNFFKMHDNITGIELKVKDPMLIDFTKINVIAKLTDLDPKLPTPRISTWKQSNVEFFKALEIEKRTMFIILMLIIIVATFNIITSQMMLVNDKTKDIAILRSMGATSKQIQRIFFYSGLLLGTLGTLIGSIIGCIITLNLTQIVAFVEKASGTVLFSGQVYFLDKLPADLKMNDLISVILVSIFLTVISSWFPSRKASKLDPVEVLRND